MGNGQELKKPILFHTGVVTTLNKAPEERISSWFMHPMRIEPIANFTLNLSQKLIERRRFL